MKEGKFIYKWSKSIPLYFPEGTQASMENGSYASYEIWINFKDFTNKAKITEKASFELIQSAREKPRTFRGFFKKNYKFMQLVSQIL